MARRWKRVARWRKVILFVALVWLAQESRFYFPKWIRPPKGVPYITAELKTTSYCHCHRCCSYNWLLFLPYQKTGLFEYRFKQVGITSSGTMVRPGTIAADTSVYPYGTIMYVPGYGYGRVEDTGGAVKGQHIDLYRPNHLFARYWGVQSKRVRIWLPDDASPAPQSEVIPEPATGLEP